MARKAKSQSKGKSSAEDNSGAPGVGHNGHPSDDDLAMRFFGYQKRWKAAKDALAIIEEEAKAACGKNVIRGFRTAEQLKDEKGEERLKERIEEQLRIARWMGVPIGTQTDLFPEVDPTPIDDRAFTLGKMHGLAGEPRKPPHAPETSAYRRYMDGFSEGQDALARSGFKPFTPNEDDADPRPRHMTQPDALR
jgi:hypothetical protein